MVVCLFFSGGGMNCFSHDFVVVVVVFVVVVVVVLTLTRIIKPAVTGQAPVHTGAGEYPREIPGTRHACTTLCLLVFYPGGFFHSRVMTGACPVTTDLNMRDQDKIAKIVPGIK